jgi:hypothetical protein
LVAFSGGAGSLALIHTLHRILAAELEQAQRQNLFFELELLFVDEWSVGQALASPLVAQDPAFSPAQHQRLIADLRALCARACPTLTLHIRSLDELWASESADGSRWLDLFRSFGADRSALDEYLWTLRWQLIQMTARQRRYSCTVLPKPNPTLSNPARTS